MDRTAQAFGEMPYGRGGRVTGTYKKSVTGLPYALIRHDGMEALAILRVIHTSSARLDKG